MVPAAAQSPGGRIPGTRRRVRGFATLVAGLLALAGCRAGVTRGDLLYTEALQNLAAGDTAAARSLLEAARYANSEDARIEAQLARLHEREGTFESRHRAAEAWRRALELDPGCAACATELGALLQRQGFWGEGHGTLRRAVELDPRRAAAWFHLGTSYLRAYQGALDETAFRDSALACCERALALDSLDAAARYRVALLTFESGDRARARRVAAGGNPTGPAALRLGLLRSVLEYRSGNDRAAAALLDSVLVRSPRAARDSLLDPKRLFAPDRLAPCDPCTDAGRDSFTTGFWRQADTTPATVQNERLLEHVARLVEADFYFPVPILHQAGRDSDRGDIYVRYGAPDWMHRDILRNEPAWRWLYGDVAGDEEEVVFVDPMYNNSYLRLRPGAGSDYLHVELVHRVPEVTRRRFGPPAPGWEHAFYRFRARDGGPALEVAYAYESTVTLDSIQLEIAAWEAPQSPAVSRRLRVEPGALQRRHDGRAVGRFRIPIPCALLEVGLQASAWHRRAGTSPRHPEWWAATRDSVQAACCDSTALAMSDLVPAVVVRRGEGGPFDFGGTTVVPSLTGTVGRDGALALYFEIYPSLAGRASRRPHEVGYRVQALPPKRWRFRDQFSAAARARREQRVAVQATFQVRARTAVLPQSLAIDVRELDPGDYELVVEVRGPGEERVERRLAFVVPERPASP